MKTSNAYTTLIRPRLAQIEAWAKTGITKPEIAHRLGTTVRTLNSWAGKKQDVAQALEAAKGAAGRKSDYESKVGTELEHIGEWVAEGIKFDVIAARLGVHPRTLAEYRAQHTELEHAFTRAREAQNENVVDAVYQAATGYDYTETHISTKNVTDLLGNPVGKEVTTKTITKHVPANPKMAEMFLTNRDPENWKSRRSEEIRGDTDLMGQVRAFFGQIDDAMLLPKDQHYQRPGDRHPRGPSEL